MLCSVFYRIRALKETCLKAAGGTVKMMSDTDVPGIINDSLVHYYHSLTCCDASHGFFIHECGYGQKHQCAVVVNLGIKKNSLIWFTG